MSSSGPHSATATAAAAATAPAAVVFWSADDDDPAALRPLFVSHLPSHSTAQQQQVTQRQQHTYSADNDNDNIAAAYHHYHVLHSPAASGQRMSRELLWADEWATSTAIGTTTVTPSVAHSSNVSSPSAFPAFTFASHSPSVGPASYPFFFHLPSSSSPSASHCVVIQKPTAAHPVSSAELPCPGEQCGRQWWRWPSLLYFGWLTPLLRVGVKHQLQHSDLWDVFAAEKSANVWQSFEAGFEAEVRRAANNASGSSPPNLLRTLLRVYGPTFLLVVLLYSYVVADTLLGPQFLNWLVEYSVSTSQGKETGAMAGYKYCLLMFGSLVLAALCRSAAGHLNSRLFLRVRMALIMALYRKALRVPSRHREDGKLNNMIATDTEMLMVLSAQILPLCTAPVIIGVGVWELYVQVGWSALVGLAVIVASLPFTALLMRSLARWDAQEAAASDRRIELTNEVVAGVRVVKYYGWEQPFLALLTKAREQQVVWLRKLLLSSCLFFALLSLVPLFVSAVVFVIYAGTGGGMSPTVVFTSLTLIAIIRAPFTNLSDGLGVIAQVLVSMRRISAFLNKDDIDTTRIAVLPYAGVHLEGAQFDWECAATGEGAEKTAADNSPADAASTKAADKDIELTATDSDDKPKSAVVDTATVPTTDSNSERVDSTTKGGLINEDAHKARTSKAPPVLTNLTLTASAGELVLVIGSVGSGKTSLLCGLLGEVDCTAGRVAVGGKLGYVPQAAFIINATLRDNIVFGSVFDPIRYQQCVTACALDADIAVLPNGDLTEIGERGINLSGGQKQRVSIARAAYARDCSVVLLDDPLSAVDTHVSDHIFHHCIHGPPMKGRTRVLVTHSMAYVEYADKIVIMKQTNTQDCYTVKVGTAASLRAEDEQFVALMAAYNRGREQAAAAAAGQVAEEHNEGGSDMTDTQLGGLEECDSATRTSTAEEGGDPDASPASNAGKNTSDQTSAGSLVEVEERGEGQVTWSVYRHYITAGGSLFFYIALPLSFCAAQAVQTSSDFWLALWSNSAPDGTAAKSTSSTDSTGYWLGVYGALAFGTLLATIVRTWGVSVFSIRASRSMHQSLLQSILRRSLSWFDRTPTGRITNRFTRDLYNIDMNLAVTLENTIAPVLSVLGTVIVIAILVPFTLVVIVPLVPLVLLVAYYYRRSNIELRRLESVSRSPVFVHFAETLNGCVTIRALGVQQLYIAENSRRLDVNARPFYYSRAVNNWMRVRLDLIAAVVVSASSVLAVSSERGGFWSLSPGNFGLLVSYALSLVQMLTQSVTAVTVIEAQMNSVERIQAYSAPTNHERWDASNPRLSQSVQGGGWPSKGRVQLRGLKLRYRDDLDLVLRGVDLDIAGGSHIGIVGRTGSGKSSLLVALFRMVEPCGGDMLVDGVSLRELSLEDVRSHLTILPQEAVLFAGSLRHNLDPFSQHSDSELWTALQAVQLEPLVRRMPQQLDSEVKESGVVLSAGQKQLLCLARALLRRPRVLCLDEATASVDVATDEVIQRVIRQQFSECTIITIAHRLNTILDVDRVIVMDRGNIVEQGTPNELKRMERGVFAGMLRQTAAKVESTGI